MAEDERLLTMRKRGCRTLNFCFHSNLIWMPGRYTVILSYEHEPFASVIFDYRGRAETAAICRQLTETDREFGLVKALASEAWQDTRLWGGMARLRFQLAGLLPQSRFNACCQDWQLAELCENIHAVVTADVLFHARRLAYVLPKLLQYVTTERVQQDCTEWLGLNASPDELLENRSGQAITLYNINVLTSEKGRSFLKALEAAVEDDSVFWSLTLCGTEEEVQHLFVCSPVLERNICPEYRFRLERPTVAETVHAFQRVLDETAFHLNAAAENTLACQIREHWEQVCLWSKDDVRLFVMRGVVGHLKRRVRNAFTSAGGLSRADLATVKAEDISLGDWLSRVSHSETQDEEACRHLFEESMQELEAMVGLHTLKETLSTIFSRLRFDAHRRRLGLPTDGEKAGHLIFTGNPGTGKTTVARLLGKIYHALGLLSKGEVISTERRELVGEYIGQTEEKLNALLQRARGNVLFIDEAYSLCSDTDDRRDFGHRVIEGLLTVLAEPNPDLLVVLAGYGDEMERLLLVNPGLRSRFSHIFHFEDYDADELMQIACHALAKNGYRLTDEAEATLYQTVERVLLHKDRHFGNARWIKRLVMSDVVSAMARRVFSSQATDGNMNLYCLIERSDVEEAVSKLSLSSSMEPVRPRIGFRA